MFHEAVEHSHVVVEYDDVVDERYDNDLRVTVVPVLNENHLLIHSRLQPERSKGRGEFLPPVVRSLVRSDGIDKYHPSPIFILMRNHLLRAVDRSEKLDCLPRILRDVFGHQHVELLLQLRVEERRRDVQVLHLVSKGCRHRQARANVSTRCHCCESVVVVHELHLRKALRCRPALEAIDVAKLVSLLLVHHLGLEKLCSRWKALDHDVDTSLLQRSALLVQRDLPSRPVG
mmetsp:Transcript_29420/g.69989  ORF Transcript_29420/g.69989 Transcript_29420/m.69989 type:complete len:231 (+) Transcript_29420:5162-5854(+)